MKISKFLVSFIIMNLMAFNSYAQTISGPVFDFVETVRVEQTHPVPKDKVLKVVYDTYKGAESGKVNGTFLSAARFINMHVDAGHPQENIKVAIVVHGTTSLDVTQDAFYAKHHNGAKNANAKVIAALQKEGVEFYICGQSASFRGVTKENILPGINFALSAMSAHAMLQSEGYAIIPW